MIHMLSLPVALSLCIYQYPPYEWYLVPLTVSTESLRTTIPWYCTWTPMTFLPQVALFKTFGHGNRKILIKNGIAHKYKGVVQIH